MHTVLKTLDFERIEALPRRVWDTTGTPDDAIALTARLSLPTGEMVLRPVQAVALREALECGGLLGAIGVGHGKTLISVLLPTLLEAKRPLLFLPAPLRRLTEDTILPELRRHWRISDALRVESYHALSNHPELLDDYQPDLIIADECHKVSRKSAARTKRLLRYFDATPGVVFVGLSGTITRKSLEDYWHLLIMALGTDAPIPLRWHEMQSWSSALDDNTPPSNRPSAGALRRFLLCDTVTATGTVRGSLDRCKAIREGYRSRLTETPGVIATSDAGVGSSLVMTPHDIKPDVPMQQAILNLRQAWCTPGGEEITDAVDYWRKAREISAGFYYVWEWANGRDEEWLRARNDWRRFIRQTVSYHAKYDTELLVTKACDRGIIRSHSYDQWLLYKDRPVPETKAVWFSDTVLLRAIELAQGRNVIVWYEQRAVGKRLRELAPGVPVFGGGPRSSGQLVAHVDGGRGPCFASIRAHGVGVNLQNYCENIVITPPSSGATWEQLIGRTHRAGQKADEVSFTIFQNTEEIRKDFLNARQNSRYIEDSTGQVQRLSYASITALDDVTEN